LIGTFAFFGAMHLIAEIDARGKDAAKFDSVRFHTHYSDRLFIKVKWQNLHHGKSTKRTAHKINNMTIPNKQHDSHESLQFVPKTSSSSSKCSFLFGSHSFNNGGDFFTEVLRTENKLSTASTASDGETLKNSRLGFTRRDDKRL
jgi:hypothetical protein